jgi:hypothetical protein
MRRWADDEFRSVNSQIEMVLQKALRESGRLNQVSQEARDADPQTVIELNHAPKGS